MQHPINIRVINDAVGITQPSDGIMMIFAKAVAVTGTFALNTPYLITSPDDLTALGITEAYDTTNSVAVYQQASEYYAQAGTGALLWLVGVAKGTAFATFVASTTFQDLVRATAQADPANRAKMLGFCYDVPATTQSAADFPADVTALLTALQTAQLDMFNQGYQWSAIIDGYNMSSTVTPATIITMATKACPSISMCITGTKPNGVASVGLALGRFSRITIGHGFGAVEDGPVNTNTAFLTNGVSIPTTGTLTVGTTYTVYGPAGATVTYNSVVYNLGSADKPTQFIAVTGQTTFTATGGGYLVEKYTPVQALSPAYVNQLGQKQYMFLRTWFNHSGFYWNDGATCEQPTKQLSTQEYNRVANSMSASALGFFINEMGKNLPLDVRTGDVDPGYLNAKQAQFYDQSINPLTVQAGTGDITNGSITMTGPNFNATKTINFTLLIVPTPILGAVNGVIRFSSTL
jgi:hypothetical protein